MKDKSPIEDRLITRPLKEYLYLILGRGYWDSRPIPLELAEFLLVITQNKPEWGYHIQLSGELDQMLDEPILHTYRHWVGCSEKFTRDKKRSEKSRDELFVLKANVKVVRDHIEAYFWIPEEMAEGIAYSWVKHNRLAALREVGVEKLYSNIKELP